MIDDDASFLVEDVVDELFGGQVFEGFGGVGVFDVEVARDEIAGGIVFEHIRWRALARPGRSLCVSSPEPFDAVGELLELDAAWFWCSSCGLRGAACS